MTKYEAKFVMEPIVAINAEMTINQDGVDVMLDWVRSRAPECLPDDYAERGFASLFPHDLTRAPDGGDEGKLLSDNELIVELAGRKCYNSFGAKAGRKSNSEYIAHMQSGDVPHASVLYHAKMSFFIAGVSRRVSHELIRNYVGADRDEEGSPSQESTRYVENAGHYIVHPRHLASSALREQFEREAHSNYTAYRELIAFELESYQAAHGEKPKGIEYKRILEAASSVLLHSVETSFIWTTNAGALAKLFRERDHDGADLEFRRFAKVWKALCLERWPNLFPQPWMRATG
jgi:thymidylate synthase (FAD)